MCRRSSLDRPKGAKFDADGSLYHSPVFEFQPTERATKIAQDGGISRRSHISADRGAGKISASERAFQIESPTPGYTLPHIFGRLCGFSLPCRI